MPLLSITQRQPYNLYDDIGGCCHKLYGEINHHNGFTFEKNLRILLKNEHGWLFLACTNSYEVNFCSSARKTSTFDFAVFLPCQDLHNRDFLCYTYHGQTPFYWGPDH